MQQDYRFLVDDQLICGLQVHVGVADRDVAVRVAQRVAPDLPTLLAMSASSPYWHGTDTGYSSFRTMVWQRWPTAGRFGYAETAADYDRLVDDLIGAQIISDRKMAYFDVAAVRARADRRAAGVRRAARWSTTACLSPGCSARWSPRRSPPTSAATSCAGARSRCIARRCGAPRAAG